MTTQAPIARLDAGRLTKRSDNRLRRTLSDLAIVGALALGSFVTGQATNRFSSQPLSIVYQTPDRRFDKELTTLLTTAPFTIAPAATLRLPDFQAAHKRISLAVADMRPGIFTVQWAIVEVGGKRSEGTYTFEFRADEILSGSNGKFEAAS